MKYFTCLAFLALALVSARATEADGLEASLERELEGVALSGGPEAQSSAEWEAQRPVLRQQLSQMLGLWPAPPRSDLKPVVTGTLEHPEFTVEKLHFQALPQVYVTANLYLPRNRTAPAPAILYVCGHARVFTNGVSCGNKTAYQHHGIWFARNGYVCLVIDSLQLGEIEATHHGTAREGRWWWNARGYTPAGVEAWFGIRALDYLCSRPEVDPERIGMTGRSGGGSYTWTVAALDDRVKVAAPVAGITDLFNQVSDRVINGHCDCMFFLNLHQWDFSKAAALLAPRPLLFANSDRDDIFPLDGVCRVHDDLSYIYKVYGKAENLGFVITPGPHQDTQELQVPVFRWFNRFLKNDSAPIEMAAVKLFAPEQLRVFSTLPADQRNTTIDEFFVPAAAPTRNPPSPELLREKVFAAWPEDDFSAPALLSRQTYEGLTVQRFSVPVQPDLDLPLWVVNSGRTRPHQIILQILDESTWTNSSEASLWTCEPSSLKPTLRESIAPRTAIAYFAPRAVANESWRTDPKYRITLRRQHMLLGETVDSMRVFDIRCAVQALAKAFPKMSALSVQASGPMGINAAYAALFEPSIDRLELRQLPASHRDGPDYLNILQIWDIPDLLSALGNRLSVLPAPAP